jgi:hypothetical protein
MHRTPVDDFSVHASLGRIVSFRLVQPARQRTQGGPLGKQLNRKIFSLPVGSL